MLSNDEIRLIELRRAAIHARVLAFAQFGLGVVGHKTFFLAPVEDAFMDALQQLGLGLGQLDFDRVHRHGGRVVINPIKRHPRNEPAGSVFEKGSCTLLNTREVAKVAKKLAKE